MFDKIIIIYALLFSCFPLLGQSNDCYEEERVITTDWTQYNPGSNGLYPNEWDWTGVSTGYRYEMNMRGITYSIVPPFYPRLYDPINLVYNLNSFGNVDKFADAFLSDPNSPGGNTEELDYHPSDGWEFLGKDFGLPGTQRSYSLFVLYNRYSGIVRPFFYILDEEGEDYNRVLIQMKFDGETEMRSALMSHASPVMKSIQSFEPLNNYTVPDYYSIRDQGFWVYADFPVTYDPCTCLLNAELEFNVTLISESDITLEGEINSPQQLATSSSSEKASFIDGLIATTSAFSKLNEGFKEAKTLYSSFKDLEDQAADNAVSTGTEATTEASAESNASVGSNLLAIGSLILDAAGATKVVGAIGAMVNLFNGNWKKKTNAKSGTPTQMQINAAVKLSGKLTRVADPIDIDFRLPGSKVTGGTSNSPIYDNTLGVFSVLETPELDVFQYQRIENFNILGEEYIEGRDIMEFQISEAIKYAINPSAKMQPIKILANMQFRYKFDGDVTSQSLLAEGWFIDTTNTSGKAFHPFKQHGPVLLPPSTDPISSHNVYGPFKGGNFIDYYLDYAIPISAGDMAVYEAYLDMVKKYGYTTYHIMKT